MDKRILLVLFLLIGSAIVAAWLRGNFSSKAQASGVTVAIGSTEYQVEVADTIPTQAQGLSGRAGLTPGHGMLFVFRSPSIQSFWMHDMRFSIDIVWIRDGVVVGVVERAPLPKGLDTPTFTSPEPVDMVLELSAGVASINGIRRGDTVRVSGYTKSN